MPAKPPGYRDDLVVLERELLAFIAEHGTAGVMPTHVMLRSAGRGDLSRAMHQHGGIMAVAQRFGLVYNGRCKLPRYWQDLAVIDREVLAFIAAHGGQRMKAPKPPGARCTSSGYWTRSGSTWLGWMATDNSASLLAMGCATLTTQRPLCPVTPSAGSSGRCHGALLGVAPGVESAWLGAFSFGERTDRGGIES